MLGDVTQTPTTATEAGRRLVAVLARLAIAYLDRMASSDWARAGVVLQHFVQTYNANQGTLQAYALEEGVDAALIRPIQAHYDANTRRALIVVLVWSRRPGLSSAQLRPFDDAPVVGTQLGAWYGTISGLVDPSAFEWVTLARSTDMSALYGALHQRIAGVAATPSAPTPPASGETVLPEQRVTSTAPSRPLMPLWAVGAIGVGVLAVAGFVTWGIVSTRASNRKRRR